MFTSERRTLILMVGILFLAGSTLSAGNQGSLQKSRSDAQTLHCTIKSLPLALRLQIAPERPREEIMGPVPCLAVNDLLKKEKPVIYDVNEGIIYHPHMGGKAFPLFSISEFQINESTDQVEICSGQDQWDAMLGYGEQPLFDNIEMRRCASDPLGLKRIYLPETVKK